MLYRYRKMKWAVIIGGLMTFVRGMWPDLILPEGFNETLVGLATAITFFLTRETGVGIANLQPAKSRALTGPFILLPLMLLLPTSARAQMLEPKKEETRLGPIEFHVMPEIGVGVFLRDDTIQFNSNVGFFMARLPGLILPNFNETATGLQVEFSSISSTIVSGVSYTISSYFRTKLAGPAYAGGNVRIASGASSRVSFDAGITAVIGIKLLTIAERVPVNFEVELWENERPVKALVVITWEKMK